MDFSLILNYTKREKNTFICKYLCCKFCEQPSLNLADEISPTLKADSNNEL